MPNTNLTTCFKALGATCLLAISSIAQAQVTPFIDRFENYGGDAFFNPPWLGFSDNCGFVGGYSFDASTSGPQISALANDGAGNNYLNFYANYDNGPCHSGGGPNPQEAISVYQESLFSGAEAALGETWVFTFDYREADTPFNPGGATEVGAFIRVLDGSNNILTEFNLDTSGLQTWQTGQLSVTLDPIWDQGGKIQAGFNNLVGGFENSGMYYDNASFTQLTAVIDILGQPNSPGELHPHHDGKMLSGGSLPDDIIRVRVFGASTSAGDPEDLDANDIDTPTLRFGPGTAPVGAGLGQKNISDYDSDGILDAQFRFFMSDTDFNQDKAVCTDSTGTLTGELTTGESFAGLDTFVSDCEQACHN